MSIDVQELTSDFVVRVRCLPLDLLRPAETDFDVSRSFVSAIVFVLFPVFCPVHVSVFEFHSSIFEFESKRPATAWSSALVAGALAFVPLLLKMFATRLPLVLAAEVADAATHLPLR